MPETRSRRPTARDLDAAADNAQHVFWLYVRTSEDDASDDDLWDDVCQAMGKLADLVRDRKRRSA